MDEEYAWRNATRGDIGSIARFANSDDDDAEFEYGILQGIQKTECMWEYVRAPRISGRSSDTFSICHIQYLAHEEP